MVYQSLVVNRAGEIQTFVKQEHKEYTPTHTNQLNLCHTSGERDSGLCIGDASGDEMFCREEHI